jgi:hypothetical protein
MTSCRLRLRGTSIASTERGKFEEFGGLEFGRGFVVKMFWPTFKVRLLPRRFVFLPALLTACEASLTPGSAFTATGKRAKEREVMQMKDTFIVYQ